MNESSAPPPTVRAEISPQELEELGVMRGVAWGPIWGLITSCHVIHLAPNAILLEAGHSNNSLFLVLNGRLSVRLSGPEGASVADLGRGETVGELSLIDDRPASAWVVASEQSRLLRIEEEAFWELVASSHQFAVNLLLLLTSRLRGNNANLERSQQLTARWERVATVDVLTGQHNRRWFEEAWPRLVRRFQFANEPLSIVAVDIDHFKSFNDRFGHAVGDLVLAGVARTIAKRIRPTDTVVRTGGEEMAVILPNTTLAGAIVAAERIRHAVAHAKILAPSGECLPQVTISLGAAILEPADSPADPLERADSALYRAKAEGRNRVIPAAEG